MRLAQAGILSSKVVRQLDFIVSFGSTVTFDENRLYGYNFPTAGDYTLDETAAVAGKVAKLIHSDIVEPVFTLPEGYTSNTSGVYIENINNEIYITLSGTVFTIHIINE